ncbi:hypothetical protein ACIPC1_39910 [Streptomyces sp. NPDC087263]|uniref:hypothetical protein n=1 Tax=Streptomyces sp. NPDC087263 TaxID=3365773 RepID=UPI0037FE34A6
MRPSIALAAVLTGLALFVSACGDGGKTANSVASVGAGNGSESAAPEAGSETDGLKFAQCMRENGLPEFEDPKPGEGMGAGIDPQSPEFQKAEAACKQYMPAPPEVEGGSGPGDVWPTEDKLKYAKCMRENGVPSFPDPDEDGGFKLEVDPNTPQFQTAEKACEKYQPESLRNMEPNKPAAGGSE